MVSRFKAVQAEHGPDSVAFISTGQIASEEMALLGAVAKFGMGMVHGDGNTRQCMATAVVAYKEAFGFDAPPYTYADLEESDVIVLWGANPCIAHPILWERICRNQHHPEVIVVDPRVTETAAAATQHYPLLPKSDLTLAYGLAHLLIAWGAVDKDFVEASTEGFEAFSAHVEAFTPERVSAATGLPVDALELMADTIASGKRVSFWWTMGVNQSHEGVRLAQALIDLALLTGNIGRPGTGANSITGQCNAMGSRLWSNTTNLLGGRAFTDPAHRAEVAGLLEIEVSCDPRPPQLGLRPDRRRHPRGHDQGAVDRGHQHGPLLDSPERGPRPARPAGHPRRPGPLPDDGDGPAGRHRPARRRLGREGGHVHQLRAPVRPHPPGRAGARARRSPTSPSSSWWPTPGAAARCSRSGPRPRPSSASSSASPPAAPAISLALPGTRRSKRPEASSGPRPPAPLDKERRLYEDGRFFHPDGKARFVFEEPRPVAEPTTEEFPFILLTGRGSSSQWHTQTRTSKSAILRTLYPEKPYVEISPADAAALGVAADEWVLVASPRGEMEARAYVTPTVAPGQVFVPMHYAATNRLTRPSFDPYSRQPSYKSAAVDVRRLAESRRYS